MQQHTIDTPEQLTLDLQLSGIGSRSIAVLVDTVIQTTAYLIIVLIASWALRNVHDYSLFSSKWIMAVIIVVLWCTYWGYYAAFEIWMNGQTPGKRLMKIRVLKRTGRGISAWDAIARNILRIIDYLPGFYGVGCVSVFLSRHNQRLGDLVADTIVVHEVLGCDEAVLHVDEVRIGSPVPQPDIMADAVNKLDPHDLELIEAFLIRRFELDGNTRMQKADRLALHFAEKLSPGAALPERPETFLEHLARALRDVKSHSYY